MVYHVEERFPSRLWLLAEISVVVLPRNWVQVGSWQGVSHVHFYLVIPGHLFVPLHIFRRKDGCTSHL